MEHMHGLAHRKFHSSEVLPDFGLSSEGRVVRPCEGPPKQASTISHQPIAERVDSFKVIELVLSVDDIGGLEHVEEQRVLLLVISYGIFEQRFEP